MENPCYASNSRLLAEAAGDVLEHRHLLVVGRHPRQKRAELPATRASRLVVASHVASHAAVPQSFALLASRIVPEA